MGFGGWHAGLTRQFLEDHGLAGPAQGQKKLPADFDRLDAATIPGFLNILRGRTRHRHQCRSIPHRTPHCRSPSLT